MSAILIAIAAAAATHSVQIEHRGAAMEAVYTARADIRTQTVGAHTPNRMDGRQCRWTATILIDRQLTHSPALARTMTSDRRLTGSNPGACSLNKTAIDREVASRGGDIRDQLIAVAERDRPRLLAELDAVRSLASN